jgi:hypothetical protein
VPICKQPSMRPCAALSLAQAGNQPSPASRDRDRAAIEHRPHIASLRALFRRGRNPAISNREIVQHNCELGDTVNMIWRTQ